MKKNANILDYVEKYKYKYGISYAQDGGRLVNTLSVISYFVWIYTVFMTALFIISTGFMISVGSADFSYIANSFITICIGAGIMIVGAALYLCKQKIIGCAATIISQPFMVMAYYHITRNSAGVLNVSFYWRHAVPAAILLCLALWILVVLIYEKIKTNKLYNMLVDGLYKQYGKKDGETLSEEDWQEFLTNYNPHKPIVFSETDDDNLKQREKSDIALTDTKCKNALRSFIRLEWAENIRKKLLTIPIIGRILSILFVVIIWSLCITIIPVIFVGIFILLSNIHKLLAIVFVIIAIDVFSFCTSYIWKYTKKTFFYLCLLVTIPVIVLVLSLIFM